MVLCREQGTTEAGWAECDVMRGGNTGGCTLIIGNNFMRKQVMGLQFAEREEERGFVHSKKWKGEQVPMSWGADMLEEMSEQVAKNMGTSLRTLKKMEFTGGVELL